ncbi:energy transducer TonB [Opitutus sp. ER46]|uniref:energy transducer TonB n=1 Tax=Opitutus sp. ER46 TaxID=2161864 RepID=UPI000D327AC3|nr:energy transducer TonB [Opitutus sp. ER46]PTX98947.1 hypothetical protein DB354_02685 [Opitutus sp. ER46]
MERHFVLPVAIAAALHGLLFGLPRGPVPEATPRSTGPKLPPYVLPLTDLPPVVDRSGGAGKGESDVSRLPERPVPDATGPWVKPVGVDLNPRVSPGPVDRVPIEGLGDGTGTGIGPGRGWTGIVGTESLDRTPNPRTRIPPEYPPLARRDGREGEVHVEFVVDESGRVTEARAVHTSDSVFNDAAVRAVSKWRFEPGTVNGVPVRFRMVVPMVFRLNGEK